MQKVLGIDLGSYSLKVVVLRVEEEFFTIEQLIELPIPERTSDSELKLARIQLLKQAIGNIPKTYETVYTTLGSEHTVSRVFDFQNVKRRNRGKIIENEFDSLGLFQMEDYVVEYHTIKFEVSAAKVLGVLINKKAAIDLIESLNLSNLMCRIIDIECFSLLNLTPFFTGFSPYSETDSSLVIDIGHSKTTLVIISNCKVLFVKTINLAGAYFTSKISKEFGLSYAEATLLKHGVSIAETTHEKEKKAQQILIECCKELSQEIERTLISLSNNVKEYKTVTKILITGGSSQISGIEKLIELNCRIPAEKISLDHNKYASGVHENGIVERYSVAMAAALRGNYAKTNSKINLRHGDLALVSNYEKIISEFFAYSRIVALVIICLLGTYIFRLYLYDREMNTMKSVFKADLIFMLKTEPKELKVISSKSDWNLEQYTIKSFQMVRQAMEEKKSFVNEIYSGTNLLPLSVLNVVSSVVPKELYFEVSNFKVQENTLYIEADTDSSESAKKIIEYLAKIKILSEVQKKSESLKAGSEGKITTFSVTANISDKGGV